MIVDKLLVAVVGSVRLIPGVTVADCTEARRRALCVKSGTSVERGVDAFALMFAGAFATLMSAVSSGWMSSTKRLEILAMLDSN
jgi:hypothetical protein